MKIILLGEPMGLFMAQEPGPLSQATSPLTAPAWARTLWASAS